MRGSMEEEKKVDIVTMTNPQGWTLFLRFSDGGISLETIFQSRQCGKTTVATQTNGSASRDLFGK